MTNDSELTRAVLRVGGGRGFVVEMGRDRVVITAAHCLPWDRLPPPHPARHASEVTFPKLLGPLGRKRPTVWAECQFIDLVGDIAVLGAPDSQIFSDEAHAFDELVDSVTPFAVADAPEQELKVHVEPRGRFAFASGASETVELPDFTFQRFADATGPVRVLSLGGQWLDVTGRRAGGRAPLAPSPWLSVEPGGLLDGGMSGSPIIRPDGAAMALVSTNDGGPIIREMLPVYMTRALGRPKAKRAAAKKTRASA
jgi:hypothetical protein